MKKQIAIVSAAMIAAFVPAIAGTPDIEIPLEPVASTDADWSFDLALYAPLMGLDGKSGVGPLVSDLDISFSDILDNLDAAFSGAFTARYDRWSVTADLIWLKLSDSASPALNSRVDVDLQQYMGSLTVAYEVFRNDSTSVELVGGAAVTSLDVDIDLFTPLLPITSRSASDSETWIDPIIGVRLKHKLSERWSLFGTGVVGIGGDSDEYWQALAGIGYRINDNASLALAYRAISVDYEDGGFLYDATASGPNLGLIFHF